MRHRFPVSLVLAALVLLGALPAHGGISTIFAHGEQFSPTAVIPVFVDTARNSILVKGQFMDLCTGVESTDSSFTVSIGTRTRGANSAVQILVGASSAPDQDGATIKIKFVSGEETFKVKAHKIKIDEFHIRGRAARCRSGETIDLVATGDGMRHVYLGVAGALLRVASAAEERGTYETGHLGNTDDSTAVLEIKCKNPGTFQVTRQWFADRRLSITHKIAAGAMVRGTATLTVTVEPALERAR